MKINALSAGLAGGTLFGICCMVFTMLAVTTGYGTAFLQIWTSLYPGYELSWKGSFIGLAYGFVDGFIWLYLLAALYNFFNRNKA